MTDNTTEEKKPTPYIDLPVEEQAKILARLETWYKLLDVQARIEDAKSRQLRGQLEQVVLISKLQQAKEPSNEATSQNSKEGSQTE